MGNAGIAIIHSTTGTGRIYFGDNTGSSADRHRGFINYYHNDGSNSDYMMFGTAGSEKLRIDSSGNLLRGGESQNIGANGSVWNAVYANTFYGNIEGGITVTDDITITFGKQAEPYGIAWGLHRPSNNPFISLPREHAVHNGVGVGVTKWGVGFNALYSNANEEGDNFWGARVSYSKWNTTFGLSLNSNEAQLVDVSGDHSILGIPVQTSFEYDLAAEDEAGESDPSFWLRGKVSPEFAKGAFFMLGYNSNEELSYGLGYNCSDKVYISSELSNGIEGDESDLSIRVSYKF